MAKPGAGDLFYKVDCQDRPDKTDEFGNPLPGKGDWTTKFTVRAAYRHLRGGESVIAARLENRHPLIITLRASSQSRQITADWRLVDARDGTIWAIRDVTHETDRQWISLLCERGVAA